MTTTLAHARSAHVAAMEACIEALLARNPAAIALHNAAYARLHTALRSAPTAPCGWCEEENPAEDLKPLTHEGVGDWFEEHKGFDRTLKQCPYCRERWYRESGYSFDWAE
jgi:hypothetical protein